MHLYTWFLIIALFKHVCMRVYMCSMYTVNTLTKRIFNCFKILKCYEYFWLVYGSSNESMLAPTKLKGD